MVFASFLDQHDPDTPCYSPTTTLEPPKSTSENPGQGCDVGLGREKYMGGNDEWGQTWSHTSLGKCERHRILFVIHWLTINARQGIFIQSGESQEKLLWVRREVERDGGSFKLLSLVLV